MLESGRKRGVPRWCFLLGVLLAGPALGQPAPEIPQRPSVGRIVGKVAARGSTPIAYANVVVLGTRQGTMTDDQGQYVLAGVPAGMQQVQILAMGHERQVQSVRVVAGSTVTLDFALGVAKVVKTLDATEVTGLRRIDTKSSTSKQNITREQLRETPVDNLRDAVALKAGIVSRGGELHVRGGRGGEVKFHVDGIEVSDPLLGRNASIASLAVQNVEVLSGGFDAEYGNALSGVVNVSTIEGGDLLGGEIRWDTDRFGDATKTFNNYDRFTFGFGGPSPLKNLTYWATYEGTFSDTYLRTGLTKPQRTFLDFIQLGNRQSNQIYTSLKLAYRPSPKHKLTLQTTNNRTLNTPYNHMWSRQGFVQLTYDTVRTAGQPDAYHPRYGTWSPSRVDSTYVSMNLPDHVPTTDDRYRQFTAVWTNQISDKTVTTSRLSHYRFETLSAVGRKLPWEYDTQSPFYWSGNTFVGTENNPYYATHGDFPAYARRSSSTYTAKSDFSTRRWKQHTLKTGIEAKYVRVQNLDLLGPNNESNGLPGGGGRSDFTNYNPEGSAYIQDRWEFEGLVLNAGIRYDLFTPGDQVRTDDLSSSNRYKQQVSPRLGIAYPISDKDVLSFHYGWTYQVAPRIFIFQNRELASNVAIRGNPLLDFETNVSYQAGVQHLFSRDVSGQFAVFFKDIYGLITARQANDVFGNLVTEYRNGDYASARGFETSVIKSFSHKFSAEVNYTYSLATGVASDPNSALQFFNGGRLYLPIAEQPLDWDQRHTVSIQGVVRDPGKWGFRVLWLYGSGFPFTPTFRNDRRPDPKLDNSRQLPATSTLTVDGDKYYRVWGQNLTLFFDARNLLDVKNIANLEQNAFPNPFLNQAGRDYLIYYTETGRAGGAYLQDANGDGLPDWIPVHDPRALQEGRSVRMGINVSF